MDSGKHILIGKARLCVAYFAPDRMGGSTCLPCTSEPLPLPTICRTSFEILRDIQSKLCGSGYTAIIKGLWREAEVEKNWKLV